MSDRTNNLPRCWVTTTIGEIVYLNPRWMDQEPAAGDLVSFVPMAAVEAGSGRLDPSTTRPWQEVNKGYTRFQERDVLFAKITPCMENGKFALATGLIGGRGVGSTEFHVLRTIDGIEPKFVLYFLLREGVRLEARLRMKGAAGQLRVPPEFLEALNLALPPAQEQRRIVAEIEKRMSVIEELQLQVEANLKRGERLRQAILKRAFEGKLVPQDPDDEPASVLLERIRAEREATERDRKQQKLTSRKPPTKKETATA